MARAADTYRGNRRAAWARTKRERNEYGVKRRPRLPVNPKFAESHKYDDRRRS